MAKRAFFLSNPMRSAQFPNGEVRPSPSRPKRMLICRRTALNSWCPGKKNHPYSIDRIYYEIPWRKRRLGVLKRKNGSLSRLFSLSLLMMFVLAAIPQVVECQEDQPDLFKVNIRLKMPQLTDYTHKITFISKKKCCYLLCYSIDEI